MQCRNWHFVCTFAAIFTLLFDNVTPNNQNIFEEIDVIFKEFLSKFKRNYANDSSEYTKRKLIFRGSTPWKIFVFRGSGCACDAIDDHQCVLDPSGSVFSSRNYIETSKLNSERLHNVSAWFGMTKFSDWTENEFKDTYLLGYKIHNVTAMNTGFKIPAKNNRTIYMKSVPNRLDWRKDGIITPIKNQESCGACWAFSTVENVESLYAARTGRLLELSVQEMIDCSYTYRNVLSGCFGGSPCLAFDWLKMTQKALVPEKKYPLHNKNAYCRIVQKDAMGVKVNDFHCENFSGNEDMLLNVLATHGPVTVGVDAAMWRNYMGGIIQYHCPTSLNHAVQVVGYDLTGPVPYYIVRNSWGKDWGISGYMYLKYGANMCGVSQAVSWVKDIKIVT